MRPSRNTVLKGFLAGAAAGGLTTGVEVYLAIAVFGWFGAGPPPPTIEVLEAAIVGLPVIPFAAMIASLAFLVGLVIVGLPMWLALNALGLRARWIAVVAGSVLAPASLWVMERSWEDGGSGLSSLLVGLVLSGAVAGWTLHRVAYGGRKPS